MYMLLLLPLCVTLCCGHQDNEDWTDPTDMFNYDAATGKMIKEKHNMEEKVEGVCEKEGEDACLASNSALVMEIERAKQAIEVQKHKEDLKPPERNCNPVFRRYLRKMLYEAERFGLPEDSSSEVYYNAEMVLTKQMVVEIKKFIDDEDWNLGALEDSLIRTLVQFRFHNVKEWWSRMFEDYIGIDFGTTFKILLCCMCVVSIIATEFWSSIGWFTQIRRLFVLSFIVSVAWNWMYLYKVAFAERQAELAKLQKFDISCGEKISWSESLFEWLKGASTFQNDPCEEYYKSLMINPALMVPPTKALALTFTDFITEPLKHVGKALGEFLNGLLAEIPVFYQLLVLILIAVIIMVSCYGASTTISQALMHRNNRNFPQDRLPPAEPQRPQYGNVIEGWQPPPYHMGPQYVPIYRYPQNQRPESLQAMDVSEDRNNLRLPSFADGGFFPLKDSHDGREHRKEEFVEGSMRKTAKPEELKEKPNSPQHRKDVLRLESSSQPQRKEDPAEQKSARKPIQEITNSTQESKAEPVHEQSPSQEHMEVKPADQEAYSDHGSEEEPVQERSPGHQQRREISVEEISHELKGAVKRDSPEPRINQEELLTGCEAALSS
ncbi:chloride channel CLIC-like protein 1 isoform 2-T2 [Leptodactylus fuscus]|uniref:chloride channel CLIC-like protein 1 isoform X2 n=1 Tax=Leptodactylus fuscus TaxID=238119 RepID=UPI003F4EBE6B